MVQLAEPITRETLTRKEAAKLAGVDVRTLLAASKRGEPVGVVRVGRRTMFLRSRLMKWLESAADK